MTELREHPAGTTAGAEAKDPSPDAVAVAAGPVTAAAWTSVCPLERLQPERAVAALVAGEPVAVVRTHDDRVFALANHDPFGGAGVLARGIVGTRLVDGVDVPFVASPLHKQAFDLRTGQCLDDPAVSVPAYEVVVSDGTVLVGGRL